MNEMPLWHFVRCLGEGGGEPQSSHPTGVLHFWQCPITDFLSLVLLCGEVSHLLFRACVQRVPDFELGRLRSSHRREGGGESERGRGGEE